jgi:ferrous iron transport protein A
MIKMTDLPVRARGRICCLAAEGTMRRRLMDLGFIPGTEVETVRRRPGGGLAVYLLRGTMIALRKGQSDYIYIERSGYFE